METPVLIPIEKIDANPYQPRQAEDAAAVAEIADSIARNGLMQTPTARRVGDRFQLAFGHTRLAAYKLLQEPCMPLIVRDLDDLQMFELGVSENIKRRDLNPIEQAEAMRRYMQEFGKNSVEAGEFFNVSEEQVRGTVRLINLAPEAQKALAEGKITITAARSLLSMQKIAPSRVIAETVKHLEEGKDSYGRSSTPDETIEHALRGLDESVSMWNDSRDGKPRSHMGYDEPGWLLSNKSFPNKLLPELTPVELAIALGIQDDEQMMSAAYAWTNAYFGQADAYELENGIADKLPADLVAKIQHLLNPPACTACPFYTRINGGHYCGMKTCHTRKTQAWYAHILQQAVNNLRIPLYDKKDGKYQILTYEHEKLFTARNKDLRLIPRDQVKGYHYQHFTGVEDAVFLVVMTGKTMENKTKAVREARAVEKAQQSVVAQRVEIKAQARPRLNWEATIYLANLFAALPLEALETLAEVGFVEDAELPDGVEEPDEDQENAYRAQFLRRQIALAMLSEKETYADRQTRKTAAEIAAWLEETAKGWGVKLPRAFFQVAEKIDEEIAAVTAETAKAKKNGKK